MSAIFKFSTKLLAYVENETGGFSEGGARGSQHRGSLAAREVCAAREAWSSERLGCLAEILSGDQALLLDEEGLDEWYEGVDAAERAAAGGGRKVARRGGNNNNDADDADDSANEEDDEEGQGGSNRKIRVRKSKKIRGEEAGTSAGGGGGGGEKEDENGEVDTEMSVVSEEVCLFKWVARKECEQATADAAAAAEALTPESEPSGSVTPHGEGAIPLTPVGAKAGAEESAAAGPSRSSLQAAAATAGALTGAAAAAAAAAQRTPAAQPPLGPLTAPHILDMLASQACDPRAATRKSAVQLAGSTIALFQVADAPASLLKEAHDRVLPLLQRLAADVSVSVRRAVLDATIALMQRPNNSAGQPASATAKGQSDASWAKVWARIVLPLVQDAEPTVFEAAISEVCSGFLFVFIPPMHSQYRSRMSSSKCIVQYCVTLRVLRR